MAINYFHPIKHDYMGKQECVLIKTPEFCRTENALPLLVAYYPVS